MNDIEMAAKTILTQKVITDFPDGNFLYVEQADGKTNRHFPYKGADGKINAERFKVELARIPQSKLSEETKRKVIAKARRIANEAKIDVGESFLDDYEMIGALFPPYLETTLAEFNDGTLLNGKYEAEEYCFFGRKLARAMSNWTNSGSSVSNYDENGNQTSSASSNEGETETEWEYHDGLVVRTRTSNDDNWNSNTEYSQASIVEQGVDDIVAEAKNSGGVIRSLRTKKKMTREAMASKIGLTAARLREIEEGDDYDDDELGEIASGLGMNTKKLKKAIEAFAAIDESTNGLIKIVDRKVKIVSPPFTIEKFEEFKAEFYPTVPKHVYAECGYDKCHELIGTFIQESIQEEKDGSLKFSVPLFKENELTYNNNRYTTECSENMLKHLAKLNKRNSTLETAFLDALKESVGESSNAAYVIESMKQQPLLMLASHDARQGKGNFLKDVAGRVLGGRREKVEGSMCFVLECKTISCPTGDQISGLMREGVMRGVSLFSYPFKFEDNKEGAHDVHNMLLVGTDFTNEGGNLRHFKDKALAAPQLN